MEASRQITAALCTVLCLMIAAGGVSAGPKLHPIKELCKDVMNAVPSPDGRSVAMVRANGLSMLDLSGGSPKTLFAPAEGRVDRDLVWSPRGDKLGFNVRTGPARLYGKVIDIRSRKLLDAGELFSSWSPDGTRFAWVHRSSGRDRSGLVVADAATGKALFLATPQRAPDGVHGLVPPKLPPGGPDPARPETWGQSTRGWISPDGMKVVWGDWKADWNTGQPPGPPGFHGRIWLEGDWLGLYGPTRMDRKFKLLGRGDENRISDLLWYPDSTRVLFVVGTFDPRTTCGSSRLYVATMDGRVTMIHQWRNVRVGGLRVVDPKKHVLTYIVYYSGTVYPSSLWLGESQGVK